MFTPLADTIYHKGKFYPLQKFKNAVTTMKLLYIYSHLWICFLYFNDYYILYKKYILKFNRVKQYCALIIFKKKFCICEHGKLLV